MQYREIKKIGAKVSTFGMGCMRLPLEPNSGGDPSRIDERQTIDMVHYAIDNGVNYFDTAYPYHSRQSEVVLGKALKQGGYRNRTVLATKFPGYIMAYERYDELKADPKGVIEKAVDEQLEKLQTDHIDIYLIHNLENKRWPRLRDVGILDILKREQAKGKIRFIGFSFHDELSLFKSIIDCFDWDMCQIQLNILDQYYQAGVEGLKYAGAKGIPVAIMEPLRGGSLAANIPDEIMSVWNSYGIKRSPIEWCFKWLCNFPEVMTVLSGVSNMDQLKQNITMFDDMLPGTMSSGELEVVDKVRQLYLSRTKVNCTGCGYCQPCPSGVNIPSVFQVYNSSSMFNNIERGKKDYKKLARGEKDASRCVQCGNCESECPQNIPIIRKLQEADCALSK